MAEQTGLNLKPLEKLDIASDPEKAVQTLATAAKPAETGNALDMKKTLESLGSLLPKWFWEKIMNFLEKLFWSVGKTLDGESTDKLDFITKNPDEQKLLAEFGVKPGKNPWSISFSKDSGIKLTGAVYTENPANKKETGEKDEITTKKDINSKSLTEDVKNNKMTKTALDNTEIRDAEYWGDISFPKKNFKILKVEKDENQKLVIIVENKKDGSIGTLIAEKPQNPPQKTEEQSA